MALTVVFCGHLQVDMTWHGHHHSYQRTCPVYKEECLPDNADGTAAGPVHLVIGHAGAGLCLNTLPVRPKYWERVELTHGYMRVEANGTHMHCEVSRAPADRVCVRAPFTVCKCFVRCSMAN